MALPTFFIIGAPKAGTTSLHNYLCEHPQIQMSSVKEPNFFAPHLNPVHEPRRIGRLEQYEELFDPSVAVRGEASTPYSEYPLRQGVPERIRERIPDAKFVYVVRDPVERTISHYNHLVASEGERRTLDEALADLSDPRSPSICASLYGLQLELYLRQFPQESIMVLDQADLLDDRRAAVRRVFAFLEVDEDFDSPRFEDEFLKSSDRHTYPPWFARFVELHAIPRLRWLPPAVRRTMRHSVERTIFPPLKSAKPDDRLRSRLQEYFAGEAKRLRELTGERFPSWSV
jgi:hypothetical protein